MPDRPLRIAVDARELLGRPTGVGRYLSEILAAWHADPSWRHALELIAPAAPDEALTLRYSRARWTVESGAAGTWWEQTRLPRAVARLDADVLFSPAYTGPLRVGCPMVVTIHDLSYFAHPEWFGWREGLRRRWLTRAGARRAAAVLTVSEFSAREIVQRLGVRADRVHVVRHGAPAEATGSAGARGPVVLYVGSLFERRHVPALIAGFARVAGTRHAARLVLVGQDRSRGGMNPQAIAARHGVRHQVTWHDYLAEHDLIRQYAAARVFVFLSEYEGFGMTPLEAIAFGVPPIVLDTPVAREVYGQAALYVSADPAAIAGAIDQLLTDDARHAALVEEGRRRLRLFSWTQAARATRAVLEQAARP